MPEHDREPPHVALPVLERRAWSLSTPTALPAPAASADAIGCFRVVHYDWSVLLPDEELDALLPPGG